MKKTLSEKIFIFIIPGRPVPQERRIHIRGQWAFDPPKSRRAKQVVRLCALPVLPKGYQVSERSFIVEMVFHGPHWGADIDNLSKLVLDGLKGIFWKDDHQVVEITARKIRVQKGYEKTIVKVVEIIPEPIEVKGL